MGTELVNYEMEVMERPEFTGYLIELFEQNFDNLVRLSKWIEEGITVEKRCSLRLSCAYVVASLIKKGQKSSSIFKVSCTLLTDEDDEVRTPLIEQLGELCPHNPERLMELIENRMEYVDVLLKMGFNNEKTNVRLFANDREK